MFVVDASLTLAWCFHQEETPFATRVLALLEQTPALVPALWPFEVANVLAVVERRGRITSLGRERFLSRLECLPIQVEQRAGLWLWQAILPLALRHELSGYDAAYLELALREGLPLATLDRKLRDAAVTAGVRMLDA